MIATIIRNRGLLGAGFVWVIALMAALGGAFFAGSQVGGLIPYTVAAVMPVMLMAGLWPFLDREWAQMLVIFGWLALAIAACVAVAFVPMAVLFLCAPAAAALFEKEKVVEAMFLSALFAIAIYYAGKWGYVPAAIAAPEQSEWAKNAGLMGTLFFMIAAMFGAANSRETDQMDPRRDMVPSGGIKNNENDFIAAPNPLITTVPAGRDSKSARRKGHSPIKSGDILALESAATSTLAQEGSDNGLIAAVPGGVIEIDNADHIVQFSDTAQSLFNLDVFEGALPLSALIADDASARNRLMSLVSSTRKSGVSHSDTFGIQTRDDSGVYIEFTTTPLTNEHVGLYAEDVSHRESQVQALELNVDAAQKEASGKTLFFAGVSHELRTPLNAIIGFSDMMRSRLFGPLPNKYAEYADLIHDSGQHMLDLIGDVLDLSKVEAGKYTLHYDNFDAADVVRSSIKMTRPLADNAEVRLDADVSAEDELIITADRKALRQILLNLISNAVKFTPKGGRVVVAAKVVANTLNITVSDNGAGMSSDDIDRIGEPYVQADSARYSDVRGTGLGLSLVKSLIDLHEGRMTIASQLGVGTTVEIYLPTLPSDV